MIVPANALDDALARARSEGRAALFPYLTGGYPEPHGFVELALAVLEAGADALEIGIPFSDPLLDGPSVQRSQSQALGAGVTPLDCLRYAAEIHDRTDKPLLLMGAYNPILAHGPDAFSRKAAASGATALIVPDLPSEEQEELRAAAGDSNLHLIQMVAPTSTPERLRHVCSSASGFVYCVSVAGLTGARTSVESTARPLVERVRQCTDVPLAVGFGISGPGAAREVAAFADGVIVGAALIDVVGGAPPSHRIEATTSFIRELAGALRGSTVR